MYHAEWFAKLEELISTDILAAVDQGQDYQPQLLTFVENSDLPCPSLADLADLYYADSFRPELYEIIQDKPEFYLNYCWAWFVKLLKQDQEIRLQLPLPHKLNRFIYLLVIELDLQDPVHQDFCWAFRGALGDSLFEIDLIGYFPELLFYFDEEKRRREIERYEKVRKALAGMKECAIMADKARPAPDLPLATTFGLRKDPEPVCITVGVFNFPDGVGDFHLLLKWGSYLKPLLAGKGYQLTGYLVLKETQYRHYENWMIEHIANALAEHPFDSIYIVGNGRTRLQAYQLPDNVIFDENAGIEALRATRVYVDIEFSSSDYDYYTHLRPHCRIIQNGECGLGGDLEKFPNGIPFHSGLPPTQAEEEITIGLMFEPVPLLNQDKAAKALLTLPPSCLQRLLTGETPTLESAKAYLQGHRLMLGYPQNPTTSLVFILLQIQFGDKRASDFLLPAKSLDIPLLEACFHHRFPQVNVQIYDTETGKCMRHLNQSVADHRVRIFSCQYLKEADKRVLYSITQDPGICSGDNSFAETVAAGRLPFIAPAMIMNQFSQLFVPCQLIPFLRRSQFRNLDNYFSEVMRQLTRLLKSWTTQKEKIMLCVDDIGRFLSPELITEWQACHRLLVEQYSLPNYIPGVLSAALHEVAANEKLLRLALYPVREERRSIYSSSSPSDKEGTVPPTRPSA